MWLVLEIVLTIATEWLSWRVWLCLGIAIGIVAVLYNKYPEQNGIWSVSCPAAIGVIALGFWWQYRVDRT